MRPRHPHRRGAEAVPPSPASSSAASSSATSAWCTITAMAARHHAELGHVAARDRSRPARARGTSGGARVRRCRSVHRAAGAGSRISGHHLRRRASARDDLQHRRRPVPSVRPVPRGRGHAGVAQPVQARPRLQLAPLPDHGRRRLRDPLAADLRRGQCPGGAADRELPPINRMLTLAEHPFPLDDVSCSTTRCTSKPAATCGR